jgi:tRNA(fMet)-specific endonuclease VapC
MILLDTDVCVSLLRGNRTVIEKRKQYPDQIAVSFMTVAELFYGAEKSGNPAKNKSLVEQFLITVNIINSNRAIMKRFGKLKASLEKSEDMLADADLLIAATALETCDLLVTGNIKHFSKIGELKLENWIG